PISGCKQLRRSTHTPPLDACWGYPGLAPRPVARFEGKTHQTRKGKFGRKQGSPQRVSAHGTPRNSCHAASTRRCTSDPTVATGQILSASAHYTWRAAPEPPGTIRKVELPRCWCCTTPLARQSPPRSCRRRGSST